MKRKCVCMCVCVRGQSQMREWNSRREIGLEPHLPSGQSSGGLEGVGGIERGWEIYSQVS